MSLSVCCSLDSSSQQHVLTPLRSRPCLDEKVLLQNAHCQVDHLRQESMLSPAEVAAADSWSKHKHATSLQPQKWLDLHLSLCPLELICVSVNQLVLSFCFLFLCILHAHFGILFSGGHQSWKGSDLNLQTQLKLIPSFCLCLLPLAGVATENKLTQKGFALFFTPDAASNAT